MNPFADITSYYDYEQFLGLTASLVAEGKTTGPEQSPFLADYTKLNLQRMQRWAKTYQVPEKLGRILKAVPEQTWWVITEAWCGDSAQILPQLAAMTQASGGNIELRIILRDEHPGVMDRYLTEGTRSIPKLISVDTGGRELFTWGPRPATAWNMMKEWKKNPGAITAAEIKNRLHLWYARNKGEEVTREIAFLLDPVLAGMD